MERRGERPRARIHMLDGRACARTRYQHFEVLNMNIYVLDHLSFAENRATTVCALWTLGAGQAPAPIGREQGDGAARNFSWRWCPMSPEHVGPQFLVALLPVLVDTSDGFRPDHSENAETHPLGQRKSHSAPTLRDPSSAPVRCPAHMGTMQMGVGIRGTAVRPERTQNTEAPRARSSDRPTCLPSADENADAHTGFKALSASRRPATAVRGAVLPLARLV